MKKILIVFGLLLCSPILFAQNKSKVTLDNVWKDYVFQAKSVNGVNWMKDGQYFTSQEGDKIVKYNILTAEKVDVLFSGNELVANFDGYCLSPEEDKVLLEVNHENIYRRSYKADYYVYNTKTKTTTALSPNGKQQYASFSPDGTKVAFVRENNLYYVDLSDFSEKAITQNGKFNEIINGGADWVYEEEFSFAQAFFWSPDSKKIAYYIFDEREVKEYNMQVWEGANQSYPKDYRFKYPKAGEKNSIINIAVFDLLSQKSQTMDIGTETDIYIPRVQWTSDPNILSIRRLNRLQNTLDVLHANGQTGESKIILTEKSDTYIDLDFTDDLTYLSDGKSFLYSSEKSGFKHFYLYSISGELIKQITTGNFDCEQLAYLDEKNKKLYFISREVSPLEKHLFVIDFEGNNKKQVSQERGTHNPNFSPDGKYFINYYSASNTPLQVSLRDGNTAQTLKVLEDNTKLKETVSQYQINFPDFFDFQLPDSDLKLNGYMIKPSDFDNSKKYPVLMFVYGGPGSQTVNNAWGGRDFFWYQVLADKGYIIVSVDNRGTGARGVDFKKITYKNLGNYESQDQISAANYLKTLPFVDRDRVGIWGWSYGGYMSSLCMLTGGDVFKAAIAVAPVTTWRFYDSVYTERYLQTPQENASGYDQFSPITHADKLKGKFLLIHGTGDDNVHYQNSIELENALIKAGKQFEMFYYPNRNHGIYGGNTRLHLYQLMTNFIERNL